MSPSERESYENSKYEAQEAGRQRDEEKQRRKLKKERKAAKRYKVEEEARQHVNEQIDRWRREEAERQDSY